MTTASSDRVAYNGARSWQLIGIATCRCSEKQARMLVYCLVGPVDIWHAEGVRHNDRSHTEGDGTSTQTYFERTVDADDRDDRPRISASCVACRGTPTVTRGVPASREFATQCSCGSRRRDQPSSRGRLRQVMGRLRVPPRRVRTCWCASARLVSGQIIVVTNRAGIGKQRMTEGDFADVTAKMLEQIARSGGRIERPFTARTRPTTIATVGSQTRGWAIKPCCASPDSCSSSQ